jgi:monoamine oxidase
MAERRSPGGSKQTVAVFGAGIAGLTVAHELALRGHSVSVYEANATAGGFFRSARLAADRNNRNMPSEYSWHGFGGWYHNVYAIMKEIETDDGTVYDRALSRPIDFGVASNDGATLFDDTPIVNVKGLFRMTWLDLVRWTWLMLKTWTADRRSEEAYARVNAAEAFRRILSKNAWMTWRASFGPWIGSDWTNVSLHQCGSFFRKHQMLNP